MGMSRIRQAAWLIAFVVLTGAMFSELIMGRGAARSASAEDDAARPVVVPDESGVIQPDEMQRGAAEAHRRLAENGQLAN